MPILDRLDRGPRSRRQPVPIRTVTAYASGALNAKTLVKLNSSSPPEVAQAADGEAVFGVTMNPTEASGDQVEVAVHGVMELPAKSTASWASHRRVVCAGSDEVDEGGTRDPHFATLMYHDTDDDIAVVHLHADALPTAARALYDLGGTSFVVDDISNARYMATGSDRVQTPRANGTTAQRPTALFTGQVYYDTDINELLVYDGTRWRSGTQTHVDFAYSRGSAVGSAVLHHHGNWDTQDANQPYFFTEDGRLIDCRFRIIGGSGGEDWTLGTRLNGSGTNNWSGTTRTSSTSWQTFTETVDVSYSAGDRIQVRVDCDGSEVIDVQATFYFVMT